MHTDPEWSKLAPLWHIFELFDGPAHGDPAFDYERLGGAFSPARINELPYQIKSPVLVVGGGAGLVPIYLAKQGHEVVSIDSCVDMVELSRERAAKEQVKLSIIYCDGKDMDFTNSSFHTVMLNTGVITQSTLYNPSTYEILARSRACLYPNGRIWVVHCQETEGNHAERYAHDVLGLNKVPSNHVLFLDDGSLDDVKELFLAKDGLDREAVEAVFRGSVDFLTLHHAKMMAMGEQLRKLGEDPSTYIGQHFHFERPFLDGNQQKYLVEQVSSRFSSVEGRLLLDNETAYVTGVK